MRHMKDVTDRGGARCMDAARVEEAVEGGATNLERVDRISFDRRD